MRDSIIVNVFELRSMLQDVRRTGKQYVEVTINDELEDDGTGSVPASISLCAFDSSECIDFPEIDAVENEAELLASMPPIHKSSNL